LYKGVIYKFDLFVYLSIIALILLFIPQTFLIMFSIGYHSSPNTDVFSGQNALLKDLPQTGGIVEITNDFIKRGGCHPRTNSSADAYQVVETVWSEHENVVAAVIHLERSGRNEGLFSIYFRKTPLGKSNEEYLAQIEHNKKKTKKNTLLLIRKI